MQGQQLLLLDQGLRIVNYARLSQVSASRYLFAAVTLLVPASVVTTVSCGLGCTGHCEPGGGAQACYAVPASNCSDASTAPCTVRTACHCASLSSSNLYPTDCNIATCDDAKEETECLTKTGCAWSDACQYRVDCHTLDENGCNNNSECHWSRDCG